MEAAAGQEAEWVSTNCRVGTFNSSHPPVNQSVLGQNREVAGRCVVLD